MSQGHVQHVVSRLEGEGFTLRSWGSQFTSTGGNVLEMWSYDHPEAPASVIEGHSDTVKEFVWRRGGPGEAIYPASLPPAESLLQITMTSG
jgi:hypothetical protein